MSTLARKAENKSVLGQAGARLIHTFGEPLEVDDGPQFTIRAYAARRHDEMWESWLEFSSDRGETRRTPVETTQASLSALEHWATALEPVYLEGAFKRAKHIVTSNRARGGGDGGSEVQTTNAVGEA